MNDENTCLPDLEGTISEIAAILARGWLRLCAIRPAVMGEPTTNDDAPDAEKSDPLSEKGLDYSGHRSLPAGALMPGERRRNGG